MSNDGEGHMIDQQMMSMFEAGDAMGIPRWHLALAMQLGMWSGGQHRVQITHQSDNGDLWLNYEATIVASERVGIRGGDNDEPGNNMLVLVLQDVEDHTDLDNEQPEQHDDEMEAGLKARILADHEEWADDITTGISIVTRELHDDTTLEFTDHGMFIWGLKTDPFFAIGPADAPKLGMYG